MGENHLFFSRENLTNTTSARSSSSLTLSVINHVESSHSFFLFSHCTICGTSPTRDRPCAHCSGSPESQPLDQQALLVPCGKNGTLPLWSSSQGSITQYNYDRDHNWGTFYKRNLTRALQNCQGHQKQEKFEKPLQPREPKEIEWLNVLWDCRTEKGP